ncbi:uncharacterized protein [Nicotiana sylvestris]|uniref:uncharacterized protein n=1 Tax=Nicotiana sylvestris TaxID=4096 RepID=UPI00388C3F45
MWLAKGEWTLRMNNCSQLLPFITDSSYDECLLVWHIATELCYSQDLVSQAQRINEENEESKVKKFRMPFAHCFWRKNKRDQSDHQFNYRQISKVLSDYMLYLLVMQPSMLSTVEGIGQIRFRDTCAEAKEFFRSRDLMKSTTEDQGERCWKNFFTNCFSTGRTTGDEHRDPLLKHTDEENIVCCPEKKPNQEDEEHKRACNAILSVNAVVKPALIKGDQSKTVLFDGRILAEELEKLEKDHSFNKWEILSDVWVEMLSYAAINCNANNHCHQLSKGGELITLVWLLIIHFGFGNNYQIREGHARTELVVDNN